MDKPNQYFHITRLIIFLFLTDVWCHASDNGSNVIDLQNVAILRSSMENFPNFFIDNFILADCKWIYHYQKPAPWKLVSVQGHDRQPKRK